MEDYINEQLGYGFIDNTTKKIKTKVKNIDREDILKATNILLPIMLELYKSSKQQPTTVANPFYDENGNIFSLPTINQKPNLNPFENITYI
jgi:hypothetical protein